MGALIRDGERVMDHFGMRDAVMVGLSLGGSVAQGLAVKRLDLVRGMVLSNTAAKIGTPEIWAARIAEVRKDGLTAYAMGAMARMFGRNHAQITGVDAVRDMLIITAVEGRAGCAAAIAGTDFYTPQPDPAHIGHRRSQ